MRFKKIAALLLAGTMALSATACAGKPEQDAKTGSDNKSGAVSSSTDTKASGDKLVVWTLAVDLEQFGQRYTEKTGGLVGSGH